MSRILIPVVVALGILLAPPLQLKEGFAPIWSADGEHIFYFRYDAELQQQTMVMDTDGSNQKLISESEYPGPLARLSPDGSKLFEKRVENGTDVLYVMNADGTDEKLIVTEIGVDTLIHPQWSPDSEKLLYLGYRYKGKSDLIVVNADGSNWKKLSTDIWSEPVWSPDGETIAYSVQINEGIDQTGDHYIVKYSIFVVDADGENQRQLTPRMWDANELSWSPDGTQIRFIGQLAETEYATNIFVVNATSGALRKLTNYVGNASHTLQIFSPSWSPDGNYIAFRRINYPGSRFLYVSDIFVVTSDGTKEANITARLTEADPESITPDIVPNSAAWSPDSKRLVFSIGNSNESRTFIYVASFR